MTAVAHRLGEQIFLIRVVLIDKKFVGKIETQPPERVLRAWRLGNMNGVVAVVGDGKTHPFQYR